MIQANEEYYEAKLSTARNFFKMAGNVYFFTKMTDETGTESLTDRRADGTVSSKEPGSWSPDHSEKAHRNGNARFTIFTKDEDIEIKWLKSKFFVVENS